jgi:hypothetical protein
MQLARRVRWVVAAFVTCLPLAAAMAASSAGSAASVGADSKVEQAIELREETNEAALASQKLIDEIAHDTERMATEYRSAIKETAALEIYNRQVDDLIAAQDKELESLRRQIDSVTSVGRQITPLMLRMIDTLDTFVALDTPFLPEERTKRVAGLREMMDRADVTISEKYRRLLEAYQIENEYGRTIEAYRGSLDHQGSSRTVAFLRIGRVALLYQTLDGEEVGAWDTAAKSWTTLGSEYRLAIRDGLRMARKQVAPDLITVPVQAAEVVQ